MPTASEKESRSTLDRKTLLAALRALRRGEFEARLPEDFPGMDGQICEAFNDIVQTAALLGEDVAGMSEAVGRQGRIKKRIRRSAGRGGWEAIAQSVNALVDDITQHAEDMATVVEAVTRGDLSAQIDIDGRAEPLRGAQLRQAQAVNRMVAHVDTQTRELVRLAREVGVEGRLGTEARSNEATGVWKELNESVNLMGSNLTAQLREIARVTTAVAQGDLSKTIEIEVRGEILDLKHTINTMVSQLRSFADEVSRVAREVGTEGMLGGQARVRGVSGVWRELTENVNSMANNLTTQVRNIAEVSTAIARGDLSRKITVDAKGEILELKHTINTMVDQLGAFAAEVTRVAREVGTEGVLGGQAAVSGASGVWRELTENVNFMANNLTSQVRNIAEVVTAIAEGDLSRKITVDASGEILTLKNTINATVDKLNRFAAEVTRVARLVGTEGTLGVQADVRDVSGTWRDLTDSVNLMGRNLTDQVRDIAAVTTAVANGDLTRKIAVDARGEILELKSTINTMVDQLGSFADQVTRLAREVGVEGRLGGQADVRGVAGTWRLLTDAVNSMANNLTDQVRNISEVSTAIARGDLTRKIVVDARGEILELKNTINTMVDQLSSFAEELTRVSREVGTEGRLGGQASVEGVRGTWKELTDNVNQMASNLTNQVRDISQVATAIARGELSRKVSVEVRGEFFELKNTINTMVDQLSSLADEVTRLAREVGVEGKLGGQARVRGASGIWKELTDNVNLMASNLTDQVRDIAEVTTAVATGDLSRKIAVEVKGEILELKNTINTMVDQLRSFAGEVTRVAREVGTEGVLGGQAEVSGVSGTWRELTNNVNIMARNLTAQVRGIARVVTAVARGDLDQELDLDAKGEIAELVDTINGMIKTLSVFADQVTGVARDVGVEGRLGGQADVPGAAGVWRDLVNNVNELAGNLTRQVRAIGDVATSVTKGDLGRSITVEARGEVALLKDNVNQMIFTLAETTRVNQEQDWLKTNLARFTRMLQGQRDLLTVAQQVLSELAVVVGAQHGAFYMTDRLVAEPALQLFASYAFTERKSATSRFSFGEGLVGQAALERKRIFVTQAPPDYVRISSGLGGASPVSIVVVPVLFESEVKGVIELASFERFTAIQLAFLDQLLESLGIVVATIEATMRTDGLLRRSQGLTEELQMRQQELQRTNDELEEKAYQLTEQKAEVEKKNREVELAKRELEEKAEQLALTSRYKSEFLANMSHELRTPLNSLLILARQLSEDVERNLSEKQVRYAETIYQAGTDLLSLINEVLDLAKIESGTMVIDSSPLRLSELADYLERTFRELADEKGLALHFEIGHDVPSEIDTDDMRLRQILRNLMSNAIKFTETGSVSLCIVSARNLPDCPKSMLADGIAFVVRDTGIGIARDKQKVIFEAFQQADGSTSRRYGGTGLGLSISRELATLLRGEIRVESTPGFGSSFTLFVPRRLPVVVSTREADGWRGLRLSSPPPPPPSLRLSPKSRFDDDRHTIVQDDHVLLIVEEDELFAQLLLELARERGFRGVVAGSGEEALELIRTLRPDAMTLELRLSDLDGWVLLDRLKHSADTRHIPIYVISSAGGRRALEEGAYGVLQKPASRLDLLAAISDIAHLVERRVKSLLVVEGDAKQRETVAALLGSGDVLTTAVSSGQEALLAMRDKRIDCVVVNPSLADMSGMALLQQLVHVSHSPQVRAIVYSDRELTVEEKRELARLSDAVIAKEVHVPERLLEEAVLVLHRAEGHLPEDKRKMLRRLSQTDPALAGRSVLIVDDDLRNIFALTALLEQHEMVVRHAENGRDALTQLELEIVDLVLMDIMMPEMDGYETMRRIRANPKLADLSVIALTAKAMRGDREACIAAGASDYITKPPDPEQLLSLLRVWLCR